MQRPLLKIGAAVGAFTVSALAVGPAMAAPVVSQATAQSVELSIAGQNAVTQKVTATNDGSGEKKNDASTLPQLAGLIPGNNALGAGVAPQDAGAKTDGRDGISYACAGIAGTGGGIATVGDTSCNLNGAPLTLGLGSLDLDLENLLGPGAITSALAGPLEPLLKPLGKALDDVVAQVSAGLKPLDLSLTGGLSVVEATCTANPEAAKGSTNIADTSGDHTIPITLHLAGKDLTLANLDVNVPAKPGGTDVLVNLDQVTQAVIDQVGIELDTALGGALQPLKGPIVDTVLQTIQDNAVKTLVNALRPTLLQALSDNVLKVTINDVTPGDGGKSVEATALKLAVLPAAQQFTGASLVDGTIGHVTCGPNGRTGATPTPSATPTPTATPSTPGHKPNLPTKVESGLAGHDQGLNPFVGAAAVLLTMAGAGSMAYRRLRITRG